MSLEKLLDLDELSEIQQEFIKNLVIAEIQTITSFIGMPLEYKLTCYVKGSNHKPLRSNLATEKLSDRAYKAIMFHIIRARASEVRDEKNEVAIIRVLSQGPGGNDLDVNHIKIGEGTWRIRNEQDISSQCLFSAVELIVGSCE